MKAHIYKEPRTVLLWNFGPDSTGYEGVAAAARKRKAELRTVTGADAGKTVGRLCGLPGSSDAARLLLLDDAAYPPAVIVSGLGNEIDSFVDEVNAAGAALPLKAMVTLTSRDWTLALLLEELTREHAALHETHE